MAVGTRFDGSAYSTLASMPNPANGVTIAGWFRFDSGAISTAFSWGTTATEYESYLCFWDTGVVINYDTTAGYIGDQITIAANTWIYLVHKWTSATTFSFGYITTPGESVTWVTTNETVTARSWNGINIGKNISFAANFVGSAEYFSIFSSALSDAEISSNSNIDIPSGAWANIKMESGDASTDSSGNNRNFTVTGTPTVSTQEVIVQTAAQGDGYQADGYENITWSDSISYLVGMVASLTDDGTTGSVVWSATGAPAYSTANGTTISPSYTGLGVINSTTDIILLCVWQKPNPANTGNVLTPNGFTLVAENLAQGGYNTTLGAGTGNTNLRWYKKDTVTGSENGTLAITVSQSNIAGACFVRLTGPAGGMISVLDSDGSDSTGGSALSVTGNTVVDFKSGDLIIGSFCYASAVSSFTSQALTVTGATLGTVSERLDSVSTVGNDIGAMICSSEIDPASTSVVVAPAMTATAGGTTTNVRGPGIFLLVRSNTVVPGINWQESINTIYTPGPTGDGYFADGYDSWTLSDSISNTISAVVNAPETITITDLLGVIGGTETVPSSIRATASGQHLIESTGFSVRNSLLMCWFWIDPAANLGTQPLVVATVAINGTTQYALLADSGTGAGAIGLTLLGQGIGTNSTHFTYITGGQWYCMALRCDSSGNINAFVGRYRNGRSSVKMVKSAAIGTAVGDVSGTIRLIGDPISNRWNNCAVARAKLFTGTSFTDTEVITEANSDLPVKTARSYWSLSGAGDLSDSVGGFTMTAAGTNSSLTIQDPPSIDTASSGTIIHCIGDSITEGGIATLPVGSYQYYLDDLRPQDIFYNYGVSGIRIGVYPTSAAAQTEIVNGFISNLDDTTKLNVALVMIGINDIFQGWNDTQVYNALVPFVNALQASGAYVGISTLIANIDWQSQQYVNALNPNIRADLCGADFIWDCAADTRFDDQLDADNPTYYNVSDGIHPTAAGGEVLAGIADVALTGEFGATPQSYTADINESWTWSDSAGLIIGNFTYITESIVLADSIETVGSGPNEYTANVVESITIEEEISLLSNYALAVSESINFAEDVSGIILPPGGKIQVGLLRPGISGTTFHYAQYRNLHFRDNVTGDFVWIINDTDIGEIRLWTQQGVDRAPVQIATSTGFHSILSSDQDSLGNLHVGGTYFSASSYVKINLSRSGGHITGWTIGTVISLPSMTSSLGESWGTVITVAENADGYERVFVGMIDGNGGAQYCAAVCHTSLNPSTTSDFISLSGSASTWTKFPTQTSTNVAVAAPYCFNIAIEHYGSSGNIFVTAGASSRGDVSNYGCSLVGYRCIASGSTWTVDTSNPCTLATAYYETLLGASCFDNAGNAYVAWTTRADLGIATIGLSRIASDGTFTANFASTTFTSGGEVRTYPVVTDDGTIIIICDPGVYDFGVTVRQEIKVYSSGNWYTYYANSTRYTENQYTSRGGRGWTNGIVWSAGDRYYPSPVSLGFVQLRDGTETGVFYDNYSIPVTSTTTSIAPTYAEAVPDQIRDMHVFIVGQKSTSTSGGTITFPAGFTKHAEILGAGGYGAQGADTGNVDIAIATKNSVSGDETGSISVTLGSTNVAWGMSVRLTKAGDGYWDFASSTGSDVSGDTSLSIAYSSQISLIPGDLVIVGVAIPTDITTPRQFTNYSLSATGITFGECFEIAEPYSSDGNDIGGLVCYARVLSGTGNVSITFSATASGTVTNVRGGSVLLRARDLVPVEYTAGITESWTWGDFTSSTFSSITGISDSLSISDSASQLVNYSTNVSDLLSISESINSLRHYITTMSDSLSWSDSNIISFSTAINISEEIIISESRILSQLITDILNLIPDLQFLYIPEHAVLTDGFVTSYPAVVGTTLTPKSTACISRVGKVLRNSNSTVESALRGNLVASLRYVLTVLAPTSLPFGGYRAAMNINASTSVMPVTGVTGASALDASSYSHTVNGVVTETVTTALQVVEAITKTPGAPTSVASVSIMGNDVAYFRNWLGDVGLVLGATTIPDANVRAELRTLVSQYYEIAQISKTSAVSGISENIILSDTIYSNYASFNSITESLTINENTNISQNILLGISDSISLSGSLINSQGYSAVINETINISDVATSVLGAFESVTDDIININDNITSIVGNIQNISESITYSENTSNLLDAVVNEYENVTINEIFTISMGIYSSISEEITYSELSSSIFSANFEVIDNFILSDIVNISRGIQSVINESLIITDTAEFILGSLIGITDNINIFDNQNQILGSIIDLNDGVLLSEEIVTILNGGASQYAANISETFTLSELIGIIKSSNIEISETIDITDAVSSIRQVIIDLTELVSVNETNSLLFTSNINIFDNIIIQENFASALAAVQALQENVNVIENISSVLNADKIEYIENISDNFSVIEEILSVVSFSPQLQESFDNSDTISTIFAATSNIIDGFIVFDQIFVSMGVDVSFNEIVSLEESIISLASFDSRINDSIEINESYLELTSSLVAIQESLIIDEVIDIVGGSIQYIGNVSEYWSVSDGLSTISEINQSLQELLIVSDEIVVSKFFGTVLNELVVINENFVSNVNFIQSFEEIISIIESLNIVGEFSGSFTCVPPVFTRTFDRSLHGLRTVISHDDGDTVTIEWHKAYITPANWDLVYNLYWSTDQSSVFSGVKFMVKPTQSTSYLSVSVSGFIPGKTYYFAVKAAGHEPGTLLFDQLQEGDVPGLKILPEAALASNITADDTIIPVTDASIFPPMGIVQIGAELIRYTNIDVIDGYLFGAERGIYGYQPRIHTIDGYDGIRYYDNSFVRIWKGWEDENTAVGMLSIKYDEQYARTIQDGYRERADIISGGLNLGVVDAANAGFPTYDQTGWDRTFLPDYLSGKCIGTYFGGEYGCADGSESDGAVRGISVQDHMNMREEYLLQNTGEPVILFRRMWSGKQSQHTNSTRENTTYRGIDTYGTSLVSGYEQYFNHRQNDGKILVRFGPTKEDFRRDDAGIENVYIPNCWTLVTPIVKDGDFIIRFNQDGTEEWRYEIIDVERNRSLLQESGAQKFTAVRVRKTDPIYQVRSIRDTSQLPREIITSIGMVNGPGGIPAHIHRIVISSDSITSISQINQMTSVDQGHNHSVINGIISNVLGHNHDILLT